MSTTHELELPLSRIYFHGSKGVRVIEVLLYGTFNLDLYLFDGDLGLSPVQTEEAYSTVRFGQLHRYLIPTKFLVA